MIGRLAAAVLMAAAPAMAAAGSAPPAASVAAPAQTSWSLDLGDPVLADLLTRAEAGSLDIRLSLARLERARSDVDLARAGGRPQLTIGAEAAVGGHSFSSNASGAGAPVLGRYEVDLFGRLKHGQQAAVAEEGAAQQDADGARRLVLAEVAKTYIALREAQAHQVAAQRAAQLSAQMSEIVGLRLADGVALGSDLSAARLQDARARAALQNADHAVEAQCIRLGMLLGLDAPIPAPAYRGEPIPATLPVTAVSSDAVLARADVQAAQARLRAADARRAEAVAASRPRFMLTAALGSGDTDLLYLLDVRSLAWAVAGGLTHDLFDGGAAKARVRGAQAEAQIAELTYRKTVGEGWGQARLELAQLQDATTAEALAQDARNQAALAFGEGRKRHADGDLDGLTLARLETQALVAETALADARSARAQAFVDLSLALGG